MTESASFPDHFSEVADSYRRARPGYPEALLRYIAELAPRQSRVLDCAAGSGQLTGPLQVHFPGVIACDASRDQLARFPANGLARVQCQAEALPFSDNSFELVTVAQAVHWFEFTAFEREVARVLTREGVLMLIGYGLLKTDCARLNQLIHRYYRVTLAGYWPAQRHWIEVAYEDLPINLALLDTPTFEYRQVWEIERLLAYLGTWSATRRMIRKRGSGEFDQLACSMRETAASRHTAEFELNWPIFTRVLSGGRSSARSRGE